MVSLIFGIILAILGVVGIIYGTSMNNNFETQMRSLFETGRTNPGQIFFIIGIICAILGAILIIVGIIIIIRKKKSPVYSPSNYENEILHYNDINPGNIDLKPRFEEVKTEKTYKPMYNNGWTCPKCGNKNLDEYKFCISCGSVKNASIEEESSPVVEDESIKDEISSKSTSRIKSSEKLAPSSSLSNANTNEFFKKPDSL